MVIIVLEIIAEVALSPNVVLPDWDAVADGSRPFHAYCDAFVNVLELRLNRNNQMAQSDL